jgi:hypothetical protein
MEPADQPAVRRRRQGRSPWLPANNLLPHGLGMFANPARSDTGTTSQQPPRSVNMNTFPSQPQRQPSRLQNASKTGIGNGANASWSNFTLPSTSAFGATPGGAPGLGGQARPGQLSGFAQVMGGGGGQAPIDMRYVFA